jgi:non-ribosomal peptide synthetase component F
MSGTRLEKLKEYWTARLSGLREIELARQRRPAAAAPGRDGLQRFVIPPEVLARARTLAAESGTTLFATLLAACAAVLSRYAADVSVPLGIPVSGRPKPELERVVGPFVNSMVFRADVSGDPAFRTLVRRTGEALSHDLTNQQLPFELLVEALKWPRRADRNPIFQVMFQLQVGGRSRPASTGAEAAPPSWTPPDGLEPGALTSQVDLSFIQHETPRTIEGGAVFAADVFDPGLVAQIVESYLALLADGCTRPDARLGELALMTPAA